MGNIDRPALLPCGLGVGCVGQVDHTFDPSSKDNPLC